MNVNEDDVQYNVNDLNHHYTTLPQLVEEKTSPSCKSRGQKAKSALYSIPSFCNLKGLSHEIDFKNVDENGQILALIRAAAGF